MKLKNTLYVLSALTLLFVGLINSDLRAQGEKNTLQLSGLIVDGDSAYGVPGVHVYIPRAGIGTTSNPVGFFSLPTMIGDTVIISAIGYQPQKLVVPPRTDMGFSVLIDLKSDTTLLPIVEVFPYPTAEVFKEAFLALQLPDDGTEAVRRNLDQEQLTRMAMALPMDGSTNYRFYMNQHVNRMSNRFFAPSFSLLNPFAWAEFIKSVKRGDLKNKE
jgi:hypothetical protein